MRVRGLSGTGDPKSLTLVRMKQDVVTLKGSMIPEFSRREARQAWFVCMQVPLSNQDF